MPDFEPYEHASNHEEASRKIAYRVAEIQRLYSEAVLLANAFGMSVVINLDVPESAAGGHNTGEYIRWIYSSKHC